MNERVISFLAASLLAAVLAAPLWAADTPPAGPAAAAQAASSDQEAAPSKAMREKMAAMHEQMAACLRTDKPVADCRADMRKACQDTLPGFDCPGMRMGRHRQMMPMLPDKGTK
jgi:hypothetical protein